MNIRAGRSAMAIALVVLGLSNGPIHARETVTPSSETIPVADSEAQAAVGETPNCEALKAETARLTQQMNTGMNDINKMAMSYNPAKDMAAASAGQMLSSAAAALIPGVGGLISSGVSAATQTARQNQVAAFQARIMDMAQEQQALGEQITRLEMLYNDKCRSPGD